MNDVSSPVRRGAADRRPRAGIPDLFEFFRHHGPWAPGVRLFRRVDFKAKAAFISAVFAIPIVLLSWQFYLHGQQRRVATQRELSGIEALRHTDALLAALRDERQALMSGAHKQPDLAAVDAGLGRLRADAAQFQLDEGL